MTKELAILLGGEQTGVLSQGADGPARPGLITGRYRWV